MVSVLHKPRFWLMTAATVVVAVSTFSLGQWQLRRAAQKEAVQASVEAKNSLIPLDNIQLLATNKVAKDMYRQARLIGDWVPEHTVYLDNRPMNGKSGFIALTPLKLAGSSDVILVQRGWVQRNFQDRGSLPPISTPAGQVLVTGRIAASPSQLYAFKNVESGRIRQNLDTKSFAAETGLPLLPVTLLQTGDPSEGLTRDWPAPKLGVEKNYGYAFQWFALCALTVFLYLWFQVIQPIRLAKAHYFSQT